MYWPLVVLGAVILTMRRPTGFTAPTVWAEEGREFWADALRPGVDLWTAYAGQWWMAQRLVVGVLAEGPVTWMPRLLYLVACVSAVLAVAVVLQGRARPLFGRFRYQMLAFVGVLLVPTAFEVQGNLTNLQSWLAVSLLIVLVLARPITRAGMAAELMYVAVAGTTGFLGVILAPVAVWAVWTNRGRYVSLRSGVLLLAGVLNLLVWGGQRRPPATALSERLLNFPEAGVKRFGGGSLLGEYPMRVLWPHGAAGVWMWVSTLLVLLVLYLAWRDRHGPSPIWLLAGGAWALLGVISPTGSASPDWVFEADEGWRYFVLGIAAGFLVLVRAVAPQATRVPAAVGLIACVPAMLVGAHLPPMEPAIDPGELTTFGLCVDGERPRPCELAIAPDGWFVVLE